MAIALYNGFPLVEADTGAYIEQATHPHFTADRSPFYGLFVRLSSMRISLWGTILVQCGVLAWLVLRYILFLGRRGGNDVSSVLLSVTAVISFTAVSWVGSTLMPDVFTAIMFLAGFLLLADRQAHKGVAMVYGAVVLVAVLMHNSNFLILFLFAGSLMAWAARRKKKILVRRCAALIAICGMGWGMVCSMNMVKKHGFTFSRGSDIFMMSRLLQNGVLGEYLSETCKSRNYELCQYKDDLPDNANEFLTSPKSPLYLSGGWDAPHPEYRVILKDVFTTPKYLGIFVQRSVVGTMRQAMQVPAPELRVMDKETDTWRKINSCFADETGEFMTAYQNTDALSADPCNLVYYIFLVCSTLWLIVHYRRVMTTDVVFVYGCALLFLVINAFVTATFGSVYARYQGRVAWLLPATSALVIINYYLSRQAKQDIAKGSIDSHEE